jgi:glycosyltransferase involved in cell wall biosynthesis
MFKGQVHQFHPVVTYGDAVSNHILSLQSILQDSSIPSKVFAEYPQPSFEGKARLYNQYRRFSSPDNVLLLHYSIGYSPQVWSWIEHLPDRKVVIYHNITPSHYFVGINRNYREMTWLGREQLPSLVPLTEAAWGDSDFNRQELEAAGWQRTGILPIIFAPAFYEAAPDRQILVRLREGEGTNLLFVGRVSPNKRLEDVILTFYYYKRNVDLKAHLYLVGSYDQMEPYLAYLKRLVGTLRLSDVYFAGHVSKEALLAYYQGADAFLCMSEHEGFGVPLIESMYFDLPVFAYAAAAVPETLGNAGVLFYEKDHPAVAQLLGVMLENPAWRERLVARQKRRVTVFSQEAVAARLTQFLEMLA